jgi:adenylate cyclase
MAATMTPLSLVDLLNEVFQCFDMLVDKYDLEKIKTIGDCYVVAAGVPRPRADHGSALVNSALDMQAEIGRRTFGGRKLAFRGVIGHKKFSYDLWGETVNMAGRMESHGQSEASKLRATPSTSSPVNSIARPPGRSRSRVPAASKRGASPEGNQ